MPFSDGPTLGWGDLAREPKKVREWYGETTIGRQLLLTRRLIDGGFEEGICNHFSALVPGYDDLFIVNPYGYAFRELTASKLLVCDFDGNVEQIRRQVSDAGLVVTCVTPDIWASSKWGWGSFAANDPKIRAEAVHEVKKSMEWAKQLGCEFSSYYGRAWARISCCLQKSVGQATLNRIDLP